MPARFRSSTALGVLLAALATLLIAPAPAFACTCDLPAPPQEALEDAGAVFSGEVVATWHEDWVLTARFEVDQVWKGEVREMADVTTPLDGAACGYWLEAGHTMLVYANVDEDGALSTNVCTRTVSLERAEEEDLGALGPGSPPAEVVAASEGSEEEPVGAITPIDEGEQEPAGSSASLGEAREQPVTTSPASLVWWLAIAAVLGLILTAGVAVRRAGRR